MKLKNLFVITAAALAAAPALADINVGVVASSPARPPPSAPRRARPCPCSRPPSAARR
jgi:hypothetical protein